MNKYLFSILFFLVGSSNVDEYGKFFTLKQFHRISNIEFDDSLYDEYEILTGLDDSREDEIPIFETSSEKLENQLEAENHFSRNRYFYLLSITFTILCFPIIFSDFLINSIDRNILSNQSIESLDRVAGNIESTIDAFVKSEADTREEIENLTKNNYLYFQIKNENNAIEKDFFPNDLENSNKLVNSDQIDLVRNKKISLKNFRPNVKLFKNKIKLLISNNIQNQQEKFKILNISDLLLKPTILLSINHKNKVYIYAFLSDLLFNYDEVFINSEYILLDKNLNIIGSNYSRNVVFKDNNFANEILNEFKRRNSDIGSFKFRNSENRFIISYRKLEKYGFILLSIQSEK